MEILSAIGVDSTIWIQFAVFLVVYIILSQVLFQPYYSAFVERKKRTVGNHEAAERLLIEAKELETKYETKARDVNSQYKSIFDQSRSEALKEYDKLVSQARAQARDLMEKTRSLIGQEVNRARTELAKEAPAVSAAITTQLLGKDLNV